MSHEVEHAALSRYLEKHSLKHTKQREAILDVFLEASGHITSEEIFEQVKARQANIGYTTVYRTMKLLCDAGLAHERVFEDGVTRYEIPHAHHDHLICTRCGKIVEFECQMIESAQDRIAARYGFDLLRHKHELYGHCPDCRSGLLLEGRGAGTRVHPALPRLRPARPWGEPPPASCRWAGRRHGERRERAKPSLRRPATTHGYAGALEIGFCFCSHRVN